MSVFGVSKTRFVKGMAVLAVLATFQVVGHADDKKTSAPPAKPAAKAAPTPSKAGGAGAAAGRSTPARASHGPTTGGPSTGGASTGGRPAVTTAGPRTTTPAPAK